MWLVTRPGYFVAGNVNPVDGWLQVTEVSCRGQLTKPGIILAGTKQCWLLWQSTLSDTPHHPQQTTGPLSQTNVHKERHELTAEVHLLYKEVRTKNPGMVESTAARVVLMAYTQANPGPQSLYHSIRDSREKVSYQQQQDWWGKVMLDCIQPLGQVPGAAAYQAVPTTIALSLQALTQPLRTAGWRCVYQCPSSIHGKMVLGNVH